MRVSREQFQQNREKILEAAGRLFRQRGFDAVSVADVMKDAGLTHGGFYGHFKSKEDLFLQAVSDPASPVLEQWKAVVEEQGPEALKTIARLYLNKQHLEGVAAGCVIAALGSEIARQPDAARREVTASIKRIIGVLEQGAPGATPAERRRRALAAYTSWIGAMVVARLSDDEAFSKEVMEAAATGADEAALLP